MKSCISERRGGKIWKDYMERIMIAENDRDHVEGDAVKGPLVCVSRVEVLQAINEIKRGKSLNFQKYH